MAENYESGGDLFSPKPARPEERSVTPWIIAGVVVLAIIGVLVAMSWQSKKPAANAAPDPYAAQLVLSDMQLSQSTNMAGSQITTSTARLPTMATRQWVE